MFFFQSMFLRLKFMPKHFSDNLLAVEVRHECQICCCTIQNNQFKLDKHQYTINPDAELS